MSELPFRPNVCMLVLNAEQRIFLGERFNEPGVWQFPQGGVEEQQSLEENVLRELQEELGAPSQRFQILKKLATTRQYEWRSPPAYAVGKWRGQSQTFWLVRFIGADTELKLDAYDQELAAYRWCTIEEVVALAEPKRLEGYRPALDEAREFLQGVGRSD